MIVLSNVFWCKTSFLRALQNAECSKKTSIILRIYSHKALEIELQSSGYPQRGVES
jgi:hypothetical protein